MTTFIETSRKIQKRTKANDVVIYTTEDEKEWKICNENVEAAVLTGKIDKKDMKMASFIETSRKIQKRTKANDVFITPLEVAKKHIDMIDFDEGDLWCDPCCYCPETGSYISQFPNTNKEWCEISKGVDFFKYEGKPDHICSNPPYSIMEKWINKCIELKPKTISFLIGIGNLTTRRIEILSKAGYELEKMKMMKIYEWFGMSVAVVFRKNATPCIEYDRKVYRQDKKSNKCVDCKCIIDDDDEDYCDNCFDDE